MLDTRTMMKARYQKYKFWCPQCLLGRSVGVAESLAGVPGLWPLKDWLRSADGVPYLLKVVAKRKELELQLRKRSKKQ